MKTGPLGAYLTDGAGRTLYLFTPDKTSASTCYGGCATAWPPFTTTGNPTATGAASAGTLATSKRTDGSLQVTYDGHPLYYFKADTAPGDTKGQGIEKVWFEVAPGGTSLGAPAALIVPKKSSTPTVKAAVAPTPSSTEKSKGSDDATPQPAETADVAHQSATPSYSYSASSTAVAGGWS